MSRDFEEARFGFDDNGSHAMWLSTKPVTVRCLRAESPTGIRRVGSAFRIICTHNSLDFEETPQRHRHLAHTLPSPYPPVLQIVVLPRHGAFGLEMPLVQQGNVIQHLMANPGADRSRFVLEAAEGLRYLHEDAKCECGETRNVDLG